MLKSKASRRPGLLLKDKTKVFDKNMCMYFASFEILFSAFFFIMLQMLTNKSEHSFS